MELYTLDYVAEKTMDAYYGALRHEDDFFDHEDFKFFCSVAYAGVLQDEYERAYRRSLSESGIGQVGINSDWFQQVRIKVEPSRLHDDQFEGVFPYKPFTFRYDQSFVSIDSIEPAHKSDCRDFVRSSPKKRWLSNLAPITKKVFFYPLGSKIIFRNVHCGLKEVLVNYIPSLLDMEGKGNGATIAEAMVEDVMKRAVIVLKELDKNRVVDKTQDGNLNKIDASEINQSYLKQKT